MALSWHLGKTEGRSASISVFNLSSRDVPEGQFWRAGCEKYSLQLHPSIDIAYLFLAANCLADNLNMPMAALALRYRHGR